MTTDKINDSDLKCCKRSSKIRAFNISMNAVWTEAPLRAANKAISDACSAVRGRFPSPHLSRTTAEEGEINFRLTNDLMERNTFVKRGLDAQRLLLQDS
jgi:hypothetical protein